ncbi:MAG TPA: histidinol dehydrogenase, partial [Euzebyales bacterium]|nr:histidinol dehydrogenase [Euzebyales bacterium]
MLTFNDATTTHGDLGALLPRPDAATAARVHDSVAEVLTAVRERGDAAVDELTERFDGWRGAPVEVDAVTRKDALAALAPALREALERAAAQVRWFHERVRPRDWREEHDGAHLGVGYRAVQRAGVYVPGGLAVYPSTVLMTVIPAQVAGVDEIVLCSPASDGNLDPTILAVAEMLGVDRVFGIGGAQAVAALAYGTATVPACEKVVGPGNAYVAEAKMQVAAAGVCGIDARAGTTEVAIIADDTADPRLLACDLVAQAEHDPDAVCLLITPERDLIARTEEALADEVARTRHRERVTTALERHGTALLVRDLDQAVEAANTFAAEHLEVQTAQPVQLAERIRFAGGV